MHVPVVSDLLCFPYRFLCLGMFCLRFIAADLSIVFCENFCFLIVVSVPNVVLYDCVYCFEWFVVKLLNCVPYLLSVCAVVECGYEVFPFVLLCSL